jgi:thiamine biosynthesis lipoprotein
MRFSILSFALAFLVLFSNCSQKSVDVKLEQTVFTGATMGTSYNIKIVEPTSADFDHDALHADIKNLLQNINQQMSTYIESSDLSLFNQAPANEWVEVSKNLVDIFVVANELSEKSSGAFDITVGPLVNLWGFGPEHNESELPSDEDIRKRKALIGYKNLEIRQEPPALKKFIAGLYCDLSAIAKGWGVDQVAEFIESRGFHNYLVEIGGEIRAKGTNLKGNPWRIGVSSPDTRTPLQKIIDVKDVGIATSGDYRNYFEKDGVRYSHTIDPRLGRPITHNLVSITVIHESCMMADAYATAINVLGLDDGMALAKKQNLPAFFVVKTKNGFQEEMTESFKQYIYK